MDSITQSKLKEIQINMLKICIDICKNNNIQYFLIGGSCLGAVRHKGFIPWDDDIDIAMPRSDYEKFISIAKHKLPNKYFLQNHMTDLEYPMNFSKIRDNDTTFIEKSLKNHNINHGVYIDIFPLDGYPADNIKRKIHYIKNIIVATRIFKGYYFEEKSAGSFKWKILTLGAQILYPNIKKAIEKRQKLMIQYNYDKCDIVMNYCGAWGQKEIMPKQWFGDGEIGVFEGIDVVIPKNWNAYLEQMYGDYMTPPSIITRKTLLEHYHKIYPKLPYWA